MKKYSIIFLIILFLIILFFIFLIILFLMACGIDTTYTENDVVVVTSGDGTYAVKLDGTLSNTNFATYTEAHEYGIKWMKNFNKLQDRENLQWNTIEK